MIREDPHPLAAASARQSHQGPLLLVGIGSGRNLLPFLNHTEDVYAVDERRERVEKLLTAPAFAASAALKPYHVSYSALPFQSAYFSLVLSTHVLQHGRYDEVAVIIAECARVLKPGGTFRAVFASTRDRRFGQGRKIADDCWAPSDGDEQGVAHLYVQAAEIAELLHPFFHIFGLHEHDADHIAGAWAHRRPAGLVHWFVQARRR